MFCLPTPWLAAAEEVAPVPAADAGDDLSKQLTGYWVVDFESAVTKSFLADMGNEEWIRESMANTSFEFREGEMRVYEEEEPAEVIKITVKGQDAEKRTINAEFLTPGDDEPDAVTIHFGDDRVSMLQKDSEGKTGGIGMKRVTRQEFEKRVPQILKNDEPAADAPQEEEAAKDDYPTAKPVPDKPGFVFSPYDGQVIDIREITSGTLVMDPHFPPAEKKMFRAP
jgi:hypothetical protein